MKKTNYYYFMKKLMIEKVLRMIRNNKLIREKNTIFLLVYHEISRFKLNFINII